MSDFITFKTSTDVYQIPANPAATMADLLPTLRAMSNTEIAENVALFLNGDQIELETEVKSLPNFQPTDYIYVKQIIPNQNHVNENLDALDGLCPPRPKRLLPMRDGLLIQKDPLDFEERVQSLLELGDFPRETVEKALRAAFFNCDRASLYLFSGNIPEMLSSPANLPPPKKTQQKTRAFDKLEQQQKDLICSMIKETGKDFTTVFQLAEACDFNEDNLRELLQTD